MSRSRPPHGAGKSGILVYLERLHDILSIPVISVTHDLAEVERLADHLVLLERGRVMGRGICTPCSQPEITPQPPLRRGGDDRGNRGRDRPDVWAGARRGCGSVVNPATPSISKPGEAVFAQIKGVTLA